jgi:hypothetical protein
MRSSRSGGGVKLITTCEPAQVVVRFLRAVSAGRR